MVVSSLTNLSDAQKGSRRFYNQTILIGTLVDVATSTLELPDGSLRWQWDPVSLKSHLGDSSDAADYNVVFGAMHAAPRMQDAQPLSPLVSMSLSRGHNEVLVKGLAQPISIKIPFSTQGLCASDMAKFNMSGRLGRCLYWSPANEHLRSK